MTFNCFRQIIALVPTEIERLCKHLLLRLNEDSSPSHLSLEKKKSCFTIPERSVCHTVLRFPRNQKCEWISKWSQTFLIKFFQNQTIPVVQLDFSRVCHNYRLFLMKSHPLMLKVRGPPQQPPLSISNGTEVDFQTVGSLSQQGSGSPGLLTPTCRETQPYALAFRLFSNWKPTRCWLYCMPMTVSVVTIFYTPEKFQCS